MTDHILRVRVKICGITSVRDALAAVSAGADAVGLVFAPLSKRLITLNCAVQIRNSLPPFVSSVAVFQDQNPDEVFKICQVLKPDFIQLHGSENASDYDCCRIPVIRRISPENIFSAHKSEFVLIDPGSGDGKTFDWSILKDFSCRVIVAGGLSPENAGILISRFRPYAVDVSSGVESSPGVKCHLKMRKFVQEVLRCSILE